MAALAAWPAALAQETTELLTNAAAVISLPAERAALSLKVVVTGVVTAADPALRGRFFVQDATGGVFVDNIGGRRPEPGEVVEVTGITHVGAYAPIITAPQVRQIGTRPLPSAKPVLIERLMSGAEDSQRIEISGLVRAAPGGGGAAGRSISCPADTGSAPTHPRRPAMDPASPCRAQVLVRGTAAEAHNRSMRQLDRRRRFTCRYWRISVVEKVRGAPTPSTIR